MTKARTVCLQPGCPELTPCPHHTPERQAGGGERRRDRGIHGSGWDERDRNRRTLRRHDGICHWCGLPGADQVDHVLALSRGGTDTEDNRRPIHSDPCHIEKTKLDLRT